MSRSSLDQSATLAAPHRAAERAAASSAAMLALAQQRRAAGDLPGARDLLVNVLEAGPDNAHAYLALARVLLDGGHHAEASACLERALALAPALLAEAGALAGQRRAAGDLRGALACCRAVLAADGDQIGALNELGVILAALGETAGAERALEQVICRAPHLAEPHANLASLKQANGDWPAAAAHYRVALEARPDWAELWNNLGIVLRNDGDAAGAAQALRQALVVQPGFGAAAYNLGNALQDAGDGPGAQGAYSRALALAPDHADAHYGLGVTCRDPAQAAALLERAVALRPAFPEALTALAAARLRACDWRDMDDLRSRIEEVVRHEPQAAVSPFTFLQVSGDAQLQLQCVRNWSSHRFRPLAPVKRCARSGSRTRLRIGYLSGDFGNHAVGNLVVDLFAAHDRQRVEVYGYASRPDDGSPSARRIRSAFDCLLDVHGVSDGALAERIALDGVDVLVDLSGYTEGSRTRVLTARPAALQVSWLGFPGSLGARFVDAIIGDAFVTPEHLAHLYDERILRLPLCYMPTPSLPASPLERPARAAFGLPEHALVLCCFNNGFKIRPELFDVWMRLLQAAPHAILWLAAFNDAAQRNLREAARRRGVSCERLVFAPIVSPEEHVRRTSAADLFLDTHPYSAGATAQQTLAAGVPLLTVAGECYVSRMAGSLLTVLGMQDLVCDSVQAYERKALALLHAPEQLVELRARLQQGARRTRLFDAATAARGLEDVLERAWLKGAP
jgi:predicted O-linked N-acetylglucosamine transferase (SPINDLY family)